MFLSRVMVVVESLKGREKRRYRIAAVFPDLGGLLKAGKTGRMEEAMVIRRL